MSEIESGRYIFGKQFFQNALLPTTASSEFLPTQVYCINRQESDVTKFHDSNGLIRNMLSVSLKILWFALAPSTVIVLGLVFYADIGVSIPLRCFIVSCLWYHNIRTEIQLRQYEIQIASVKTESVPAELQTSMAKARTGDGCSVNSTLVKKLGITALHRARYSYVCIKY